MRVLMTADAVGGVWTYATVLGGGLVRRGHEVHLAVLGPPPDDSAREAARGAGIELHEGGFALEWMERPWDEVDAGGEWLLELERRLEPDVVHLDQLVYGALEWQAPRLVVGHSCVVSWWRAVHGEPPPDAYDEYVRRVTESLRAADLVVAPTRAMLDTFRRLYGPFRGAVAIPNGLGVRDRVEALREREPVVLTAGRLWDEAKNVRAVDRAARDVPWPVEAAGSTIGPGGAEVRLTQAAPLGHLDADELDERLRRAAIFALPARYEPFGYGPLEAAQAGCALVLGDIATLREVWGGDASYVDPDDPGELAAELRRLAADAPLRERMAERARQRAARYSVDRMVDGYLRAYRKLLVGEPRRASRGIGRTARAHAGPKGGAAC